jgi:hypothetical protein
MLGSRAILRRRGSGRTEAGGRIPWRLQIASTGGTRAAIDARANGNTVLLMQLTVGTAIALTEIVSPHSAGIATEREA